jgi:hypothetical protein
VFEACCKILPLPVAKSKLAGPWVPIVISPEFPLMIVIDFEGSDPWVSIDRP